jgi:hypothetical protein
MLSQIESALATLTKALTRQQREAPELFYEGLTKAARLALLAVLALAVVLLVRVVISLVKKQRRTALVLGVTAAVVAGVAVWAYWPAPLVAQADSVQSVQLFTRVPGKAEQEVLLTRTKQKELLALLQSTQCTRGFDDELPYTGYGQTFRLILQTEDGEVRVLAAPGSGCRYTSVDDGLIYPILGYSAFYEALGTLAPM